jgi:hypothetical protein
MANPTVPAAVPRKNFFNPAYYAAAFAGLCLFFWFMGGSAVFRNDELQHMHTAFSASRGGLPYRDYFDNHVPAYQVLTALEIRALALKPSPAFPVTLRRLGFPLLAALLLLLVLSAKSVFYEDRERYLATALLAGVLLPMMAAQARPDPLWGLLFLLSLYLFSARPPSFGNFLLVGLVNGLNACVSLKTFAFPVLPELLSLPVLFALYPAGLAAVSAAGLLCGLLVFPGLLVLYFYRAGALAQFLDLGIFYSLRGGSDGASHTLPVAVIVLAAGLLYFAVKKFKARVTPRAAAFFAPALFAAGILALYPVREAQTLFPFRVLLYLALAALAVKGLWALFSGARARALAVLVLLAALVCGRLLSEHAFRDNNLDYRGELSALLRLQPGPGGTVMDAKGESIFWRRPFFYALETFAVQGVRAGTIKDSVPEDCARAATPVVFLKYPGRFTAKDLKFFSDNYQPVCAVPGVMAAGQALRGEAFETVLPLEYRLLCAGGAAAGGLLDGKKYAGEVVALRPGLHKFRNAACKAPLLAWDRAAQTGDLPCGYGGEK